jgi:hypothetical protein
MSFNPYGLKVMEIDTPKDVIGKDWLSFWHGNIQPQAANALKQANDGQLAKFEGYCPTFKGTMKYWEVTIAPLFDDFGSIQWLLITSRDTTKQKSLEKKVIEQEAQIKELRRLVASPQPQKTFI